MSSYSHFREMFDMMVCDTPVPYYDMGISCGLPNEFGDIPPEMILAPSELVNGRQVFFSNAEGDSMEGVGIYDGDLLLLESVRRIQCYDIVSVVIDGEQMLKTYYVDEEGRQWLVPANEKYDSILLTEDMDVRIAGKLLWQMKQPRDTTRNVRQSIMRYLEKQRAQEEPERHELSYDEVVEALKQVAPQVTFGRSWLGACRVLMDRGFIRKDRYDKFCELVRSILPHHPHLPNNAELQRMAVDCFSKPFAMWKDETAPVHGKRFRAYYEIGEALTEKLP